MGMPLEVARHKMRPGWSVCAPRAHAAATSHTTHNRCNMLKLLRGPDNIPTKFAFTTLKQFTRFHQRTLVKPCNTITQQLIIGSSDSIVTWSKYPIPVSCLYFRHVSKVAIIWIYGWDTLSSTFYCVGWIIPPLKLFRYIVIKGWVLNRVLI